MGEVCEFLCVGVVENIKYVFFLLNDVVGEGYVWFNGFEVSIFDFYVVVILCWFQIYFFKDYC